MQSENIKNLLDQYTEGLTPSDDLKERILNSARLYILAKDIGELFTMGISDLGIGICAENRSLENQ